MVSGMELESSVSAPSVRAGYLFEGEEWDEIDTRLFTHILCSTAQVNYVTNKVRVSSKFGETLEALKKPNVPVPVQWLLSIGVRNPDDSSEFASMIHDPDSRKTFIDSTIQAARAFDIDGLDLDWEYPSNDVEMRDLGILLKEWRTAVEEESEISKKRRLRLTAAVFSSPEYKTFRYKVEDIEESVDWVNLIFYDFYKPVSSPVTGPPAALFDPCNPAGLSGDSGLNQWLAAGLTKDKAVLGFSYAGWAWTLEDVNNNGYGAPTTGPAISPDGYIAYRDIRDYIVDNGAAMEHNGFVVGDYCYAGPTWIGYDDNPSIVRKVRYAHEKGLRGYFGCYIGADYKCGLSRAAKRAWDAAKSTSIGK